MGGMTSDDNSLSDNYSKTTADNKASTAAVDNKASTGAVSNSTVEAATTTTNKASTEAASNSTVEAATTTTAAANTNTTKTNTNTNTTTTNKNTVTTLMKKKIEILKSLQNPAFDETRLSEYLDFTSVPQMAKPILKRILQYFIDLDSQISVIYDTSDDSHWEKILTEITDEFETKTRVDCLGTNFPEFYSQLRDLPISTVIEILSPLFKVKTKNIQFLVFRVASEHPREIFGYLLNKIKSSPVIYCPYFSSLLVRLKTDCSLKQRCFGAFLKYVQSVPQQNTVQYISLFQSIIYILCFPEFKVSCNGVDNGSVNNGSVNSSVNSSVNNGSVNNGSVNSSVNITTNDPNNTNTTNDPNITTTANITTNTTNDTNTIIDDVINRGYQLGLFSYINKDVGTKYCEMNGLKVPTFHSTGNSLYYFPFDYPIISEIGREIDDFYIQFDNK